MIEKLNISIDSKNTKEIRYTLLLDFYQYHITEYDSRDNQIYYEDSLGYWYKREFDSKDNILYYENSYGNWTKREYNNEGDLIYYEDNSGLISDDR